MRCNARRSISALLPIVGLAFLVADAVAHPYAVLDDTCTVTVNGQSARV